MKETMIPFLSLDNELIELCLHSSFLLIIISPTYLAPVRPGDMVGIAWVLMNAGDIVLLIGNW